MSKKKSMITSREPPECFVIIPSSREFEDLYRFAIIDTLAELGMAAVRVDQLEGPNAYKLQIVQRIATATLVLADVTYAHPNVFYNLGVAHSLAQRVLVIAKVGTALPFDFADSPVLFYDPGSLQGLKGQLHRAIRNVLSLEGESFATRFGALGEVRRAPTVDLQELQTAIEEARRRLKSREDELEALRSVGSQEANLASLRTELVSELRILRQDVAAERTKDLVAAQAAVLKLQTEVEALRGAELQLQRLKEMVLVNPQWQARSIEQDPDLCFLLMPFSESWSNDVWDLIKNIVAQADLKCERADEKGGRVVMNDIWEGILRARVVIADLTGRNPNVTYEVGLADVVGRDVVLLTQTPKDVPFDFLGLRLIEYENSISGVKKLTQNLHERLNKLRQRQ